MKKFQGLMIGDLKVVDIHMADEEHGDQDFRLDRSVALLPMSEMSTKAILSQLWNPLGQPEVPNILCIIGPFKVHYALCDWGASVKLMPKMVYDCLNEDP